MTNQKHTPTPWKINDYNIYTGKRTVAHCYHHPCRNKNDEREMKANAEFIVRACNAHDELVEALKALVERYGPSSGYDGEQKSEMRKAEQALEKAGA